MNIEYNDDNELGNYICRHYWELLTESEKATYKASHARQKMDNCDSPNSALRAKIGERWAHLDDPLINNALRDGHAAFRNNVAKRVLAEQGSRVFINRCPECNRIVRTPKAKQCFWCGFDWH